MLAVRAKFFPAVSWFLRQIAPSVVATLIAAMMIAGYNHAFSGHLVQPRMAALHAAEEIAVAASEPASPAIKPPPAVVTEVIDISERAEPDRLADKDADREAGKDQAIRLAAEPAPAPVRMALPAARPEPRPEPRRVASADVVSAPPTQVIVAAPLVAVAPPVAAIPGHEPPAIMAPPQGVLGAIVNTLKPSALFSRAREFGEKIEAAGNEILPSIRP